LAVGVITYCTDPKMVPVLTRLSVILPAPLGVLPVTVPAVTLEVHAYVVPETPEVNVTFALVPEQIVSLNGILVTLGNGLTVMT
jgi:hypothetical protein